MEQDRQGHAPNPHDHAHLDYGRAFAIGIALNLVYVAGEAVGGIFSGSLALLADSRRSLICPRCLIVKRRLEKALGNLVASVRWHPFQLNPDMPGACRSWRR